VGRKTHFGELAGIKQELMHKVIMEDWRAIQFDQFDPVKKIR
jgi:hypothetical protein